MDTPPAQAFHTSGETKGDSVETRWLRSRFLALFSMPAIERLGRHKRVLWLSAASYAIYLLHQPVISWLDVAVASFGPWSKFLVLGALGWYFSVQAASWLDGVAAWAGRRLAGKKERTGG